MEFKKYPDNWQNIIEFVKHRDNYTCSKCHQRKSSYELRVHHMVPLSKGGSNKETNLQTLCNDCHISKHPHMKNFKSKPAKETIKKYERFSSRIKDSDMIMGDLWNHKILM